MKIDAGRQSDWRPAACHCGAVQFQVRLPDGFRSIRRCTCSYCRMRGAVAVSVAASDLAVVAGQTSLTEYRFNTRAAAHYFCSVCGIYTHHRRRSDTSLFGVNVACIAGVSPFDFAAVPVMDGVRHPSDTGEAAVVAGVLRFDRPV